MTGPARDLARIARLVDPSIMSSKDPDVIRHRAEILGIKTAPDHSPLTARYVNPGCCLVEWVGDSGPFGEPQIVEARRLGWIPDTIWESFNRKNRSLSTRLDGISRRVVGPRDGFNRVITWGEKRGTYIQELTYQEADKLLSFVRNPREFRIWEDGEWLKVSGLTDGLDRWLPPSLAAKCRTINIVFDERPERLVGLDWFDRYRGYYK